jgi:hypothetical protein
MQRLELLENRPIFAYLEQWQQQLIRLSFTLWQREKTMGTHFLDYSFVVFPMAKAYEGFLKSYLLDNHFISETTYKSKRFRIGRVLNPDLRQSHRDDEWLYDNVEELCGPKIAREMWDTWLTCRNRVFHYFPDRPNHLTLEQAGHYLETIFTVMEKAISCQTVGPGTTMRTL